MNQGQSIWQYFCQESNKHPTRDLNRELDSDEPVSYNTCINHTEVKTEVGYMPLLNAPADSYDTLKYKISKSNTNPMLIN